MRLKKRGQNWSFDAILAVSIFIVAVSAFFYMTTVSARSRLVTQLSMDAEVISESIISSHNQSSLTFIDSNNKVDKMRLHDFMNRSYESIRDELGIEGDFCIYFEDKNKTLVVLDGNRSGIGSSRMSIGGINCS
ncbi:hypothetical protein COV22_02520 [Candidatus Woesearchaeota archaeon CG10_big_fil_rev_8_21_14_0_10_47_5]|nr:MAG: hypothetical protein AUJ69_00575 [Candidatus Woesearchaeota archaeon CG1_02_47_18]PIN72712.1 MAG: hypothetical protein COV22_02520 [Candidatus Woesearchaeota archaeon CG10_big_fil_rev_8_21_14_0_10_47_5]